MTSQCTYCLNESRQALPSPLPTTNTSKLLRSKNSLLTKNWLAIYYKLYIAVK